MVKSNRISDFMPIKFVCKGNVNIKCEREMETLGEALIHQDVNPDHDIVLRTMKHDVLDTIK